MENYRIKIHIMEHYHIAIYKVVFRTTKQWYIILHFWELSVQNATVQDCRAFFFFFTPTCCFGSYIPSSLFDRCTDAFVQFCPRASHLGYMYAAQYGQSIPLIATAYSRSNDVSILKGGQG